MPGVKPLNANDIYISYRNQQIFPDTKLALKIKPLYEDIKNGTDNEYDLNKLFISFIKGINTPIDEFIDKVYYKSLIVLIIIKILKKQPKIIKNELK